MNKKQFLIAAVAAVLSVSSVSATNISGVNGSNGIFNINPEHVNGDVGYRGYENFELSQGDIANLIYKYGGSRDIETFINLVQNGVKIDGILNTVRDGNFHNGHAVFITPSGMTVGASGVLNVGSLSVSTPTSSEYAKLKQEYAAGNYTNINQISKLLNSKENVQNITVNGKIFARKGVQLRGKDVTVGSTGAILNGVASNEAFTDKSTAANRAEALFNNLVNTNGINRADAFTANGTNIQIKSTGNINVAGKVVNGGAQAGKANSGLYLTSSNGIDISGLAQSTNELNVYNKGGALNVTGTVKNQNADLNVSNSGTNLSVGGTLSSDRNVAVTNNGTGALSVSGNVNAAQNANLVNEGAGGSNITGGVKGNFVRIVNRNGKLVIANNADKVNSQTTARIENHGNGGMEIGGIKANNRVSVENTNGDLTVGGKLSVGQGSINVLNNGTGKLAVAAAGNVQGNGTVALINRGNGGMVIDGTVANTGIHSTETAINNDKGAMLVNGNVNNNGNLAIINNGTGMTITKNAKVTNEGNMKLKNYGANGMTVVGAVENTGDLSVYNDNGQLALKNDQSNLKGGSITNHEGRLAIWSRNQSTGISTSNLSSITNTGAGYNLAIKHEGTTVPGARGVDLQGTISGEGETAINNYSGDMYVSGNITSDGNLGIVNRAGGGSMTLASDGKITNDTANTNIKNYGSGDMEVNSEITSGGRLNVIANTGKLKLGAKVHNNSNGQLDANNGFYAAARDRGTGITASSNFTVDGTGQNLIKNISGTEGLQFNGKVNTSTSQTELYNKNGNMTVGGNINTTTGNAVVLNKGNNLTVNGIISSSKDVKVVNKGAQANVSQAKVTTPNQKWFWNVPTK